MKKLLCLLWCVPVLVLGLPVNSIAQNGSLDASFHAEANATVRAIAVQTNGQLLIGGDFTSVNGVPRNRIARLNGDGELDRTFNPGTGASDLIYSVALQSDGKVLIGGRFTVYDGTPRNRIARLNADGSLDTSFDVGAGANDEVFAVAVQTNGQVLIAGGFTSINTSNRSRIARLNNDGSVDANFDTNRVDDRALCLVVQPNGRILIGGYFSTIGGTPRNGIARLRSDGSLDISFYPAPGPSGSVTSIALQHDGKILVAGNFPTVNGTRRGIGRLNADGSLDTGFNPGSGADGTIFSIALQQDGKVVLGGLFGVVNGASRTAIARLNADGSLDTTFVPGLGPKSQYSPWVFSVVVQDDGRTLLGGDFTHVNGVARVRLASLNSDALAPAATLSLKMYAGLTIEGQTGITYRIEYTSILTNQTLWQTLTDLPLSNSPQFFLDTTSPFSTRRFYRAVTLP